MTAMNADRANPRGRLAGLRRRREQPADQVADFVSARLLKYRITGTIRDPVANVDSSINARAAIGFFLRATTLSMRSRR